MDSRLTLIQLLSISIWISALVRAERLLNEPGQYLSRVLYGDQWRLGRYCDSTQDPRELLAIDQEIRELYNGSYLESIKTTTDWSAALERLSKAQLVGAQSRQQLSAVCSINSWGYADKITESLSNEPHENGSDCLAQLNEFDTFVRKLVSATRGPLVEDRSCNKSDIGSACQLIHGSNAHLSLDTIEDGTTNFSLNYWLQLNSFGRLPSGRPYSNNLLIGDYDVCTQTLDSTRYCLGAYDRPSRGRTKDKVVAGTRSQSVVWPYRVGLCLPKSCSSSILMQSAKHMKVIDSIVKASLLGAIDLSPQGGHTSHESLDSDYQLVDLYCPPVSDSVFVRSDRDFVGRLLKVYLPLAWLALLLVGTVHPSIKSIRGGSTISSTDIYRNFIRPFDLCRNWKSFVDSAHAEPRLVGLNGVKVVAMNWLILTHISVTIYPYLSDISKIRSDSSLHGAFILQGQHGVPIFFIISGLLVGYKHLQGNDVDLKSMLLSRYFRLAPMYLIVYTYVKKFGHLMGDGPLWDYGVSKQSEARQCMNESWLVPILMLANFTPPFAHCIITGWHIANDFQIYFILPLLLQTYKYSRRYGALLVVTIFLLSHATHVWFWGTADNYSFQPMALEPFLFGPRVVLDRLALDYVNPLGRIGTYFLGVLVADSLISGWRLRSGPCSRGSVGETKSEKQVTFKSRYSNNKPSWRSDIFLLNKSATDSKVSKTLTRTESSGNFNHNRVDTRNSSSSSQEACCELDNSGQSNMGTKSTPSSATLILASPAQSNSHLRNEESLSYGGGGGGGGGRRRKSSGSTNGRNIPSSSFKANTMVLMGMCLSYGAVFSALLPDQLKLTFGPKWSKAISYPLCRFVLEIGWALLLYCLLRDGQQSTSARATASQRLKTVRQAATARRASRKTKSRLGPGVVAAGGDDRDSDEDKDADVMNGRDTGSGAAANCLDRPEVATIGSRSPQLSPSSSPSSVLMVDEADSGFVFGFGGFLLKKSFWNVLVKLNYTLMLTHYTLVRYVVQSQRQLIAFTWTNYFQLTAFLLLAAYALSLLVHLTIEMPVTSLTKLSLSKVIVRRRPVA